MIVIERGKYVDFRFTESFGLVIDPNARPAHDSLTEKITFRNINRFFVIRKLQAVFTNIFNP